MTTRSLHVAIDCRKAADLGIGRYIVGLTHGLAATAHNERFTLLVDESSAHLLPSGEQFRHVTVRIRHYSPIEPRLLGHAVNRLAPDLVHAPHYVLPATHVPRVVTIHDLIHLRLHGRGSGIRRLYAATMMSRAVRQAYAILTVSESVRTEILATWPNIAARLDVTPNGVSPSFAEVRRQPDDRAPFFLYAGNDKPHKNLDRLIEAWQLGEPPPAKLVIAGCLPERHRAVPGVELKGRVTEEALLDLYSRATALVFPSLDEGFGLPVAEAMAAGVPVAASAISPVIEVAADAFLPFDPSEPRSIRNALDEMLSNASLRRRLTKRGRRRALRYRWDRTAEATLEIYRSAPL